jgi:hypothetical protein
MEKRGELWDRTFSIVRCLRCGLVYVNPRIAADQIPSLYDDAYHRGDGFDRTVDFTDDDGADPVNLAKMRRIVATLGDALGTRARHSRSGRRLGPRDAARLPGGCGRARGGPGVDRRRPGAVQAARTFDRGDSVEDVALRAGTYDAVTATEVIEHFTSPTAFLLRVRELLKPGGVFYYTTGNWHIVRRSPGTAYVMPDAHLYYFTPSTMRKYLKKAGFQHRCRCRQSELGRLSRAARGRRRDSRSGAVGAVTPRRRHRPISDRPARRTRRRYSLDRRGAFVGG